MERSEGYNKSRIMFLEAELERLQEEYDRKKKELLEVKVVEWINDEYGKYEDLLDIDEFRILCELVNAQVLFSLYDNDGTVEKDYFLGKVGMMLGCMEDDVRDNFGGLIGLYEDLDEFMEVEYISDRLNYFRDNLDKIENDDFSFMNHL